MPEPPNRRQRRDERFGREHADEFAAGTEQQEQKPADPRTAQDVTSVRAKSQGHGKKTADKWNQ